MQIQAAGDAQRVDERERVARTWCSGVVSPRVCRNSGETLELHQREWEYPGLQTNIPCYIIENTINYMVGFPIKNIPITITHGLNPVIRFPLFQWGFYQSCGKPHQLF